MKVNYEGTDVLIVDKLVYSNDETPKEIRAVIACNDKAEKALYTFANKTLSKHGIEIGTLRTVFGLTFYANDAEGRNLMMDFIKEKQMQTYHGHI